MDNDARDADNQVLAQATQAGAIVEKDGSDESILLRLLGPQSVELWITAELLTQNNPNPSKNTPNNHRIPVQPVVSTPTHLEVIVPKKTETHDEVHPADNIPAAIAHLHPPAGDNDRLLSTEAEDPRRREGRPAPPPRKKSMNHPPAGQVELEADSDPAHHHYVPHVSVAVQDRGPVAKGQRDDDTDSFMPNHLEVILPQKTVFDDLIHHHPEDEGSENMNMNVMLPPDEALPPFPVAVEPRNPLERPQFHADSDPAELERLLAEEMDMDRDRETHPQDHQDYQEIGGVLVRVNVGSELGVGAGGYGLATIMEHGEHQDPDHDHDHEGEAIDVTDTPSYPVEGPIDLGLTTPDLRQALEQVSLITLITLITP